MSGVEKYEYTGEASLNNEGYKIYLTKQYNIEKIETIGKFQSQDKTFEKVFDALRYAQSIDRGIALEYLDEMDPISSSGISKPEIENTSSEKPLTDKIVNAKIQNTGVVSKSSGGSGFLIGLIAVLCLIGLFYYASQNEMPSTSSLQSLETREDISNFTINGELAKAFNLNSKYTDIQRENLWRIQVRSATRFKD